MGYLCSYTYIYDIKINKVNPKVIETFFCWCWIIHRWVCRPKSSQQLSKWTRIRQESLICHVVSTTSNVIKWNNTTYCIKTTERMFSVKYRRKKNAVSLIKQSIKCNTTIWKLWATTMYIKHKNVYKHYRIGMPEIAYNIAVIVCMREGHQFKIKHCQCFFIFIFIHFNFCRLCCYSYDSHLVSKTVCCCCLLWELSRYFGWVCVWFIKWSNEAAPARSNKSQ